MASFNPAEYSSKMEARRTISNIETYFADWHKDIYDGYKVGKNLNDHKALSNSMRQIREYNQAIVDKGAAGLIPRIKLSNVVRASKMGPSARQKREATYIRNSLST
jgi:hypothetical protein